MSECNLSGNTWSSARTVIEEPLATLSIENLSKKYSRFSDQWMGITWLLARKPKDIGLHKRVGNNRFYLANRSGDKKHDLVEVAIVYTFDDDAVTIYDVNAWESEK